jgi:hypothetical protein
MEILDIDGIAGLEIFFCCVLHGDYRQKTESGDEERNVRVSWNSINPFNHRSPPSTAIDHQQHHHHHHHIVTMPRAQAGTPKAIANAMKAKGDSPIRSSRKTSPY